MNTVYKLVLTRTDTNKYTIVDYNDERLYLCAQILLHPMIRSRLKSKLDAFDGLQTGEKLGYTTEENLRFELHYNNNMVTITLSNDPYYPKNLETEFSPDALINMFDSWQDLTANNYKQIILTREADKDFITLTGIL